MNATASTSGRIRPMVTEDLERVLGWRNHHEVRRYMYTQHEITLEEHTRWFERTFRNPSHHLLIFESDSVPLGFINIHESASRGVAAWGFYVAPDAPKGTGCQLGQAALHYAFSDVGLQKLCGQALAYNERSIKFHLSQGFQQEGVLRDQHFDGQGYHHVVCFGLLAREWQAHN